MENNEFDEYSGISLEILHIPNPMPKGFAQYLVCRGMIAKRDLIHDHEYYGHCRNAKIARWDSAKQKFIYKRHKFDSTYDESINHPENDDGHDLFIPIKRVDGEKIVASAVKCNDGKLYLGKRHCDCFNSMIEEDAHINSIQGFITNRNRFVDRYEGLEIAMRAQQVITKHTPVDQLCSEDLW